MLKSRNIALALVAAGFVVAIILFHGLPCLHYKITGWYCPGCGITRMFLGLLRGDFYQAFRYNPLVFVLLPFAILLAIDYSLRYLRDVQASLFYKIPDKAWLGLLILLVVYGVLRNLPVFDFLAPTILN